MMTINVNGLAVQDFEQARRKAFWRDLFSYLTRTGNNLRSFDQIRRELPLKGWHYRGVQTVSLDQIVGSEGRYRDFDRAFFPRQSHTQARWVSIDQAYYEQKSLPPIELVKVGEIYFVRDGHHRVSVARLQKQAFIEAYVTEFDVAVPDH